MEEPPFTLTPPKWDESEAVVAREFFQGKVGQKFLQLIRYHRPAIIGKTSDDRRTEHELLQGYELCFRELFHLLNPKT